MKRLLAVLATPLLLAACSAPARPPAAATPSASAEAPPIDPSLGPRPPAGTTGGPSTTLSPGQGVPAILDCGTFKLGRDDRLPADAADCFVDAVSAGHPARLKVTVPTIEGDPIPRTYTAGSDGRTEVVHDHRGDFYGDRQILTQSCQGPSARADGIDFTKCTQLVPVRK